MKLDSPEVIQAVKLATEKAWADSRHLSLLSDRFDRVAAAAITAMLESTNANDTQERFEDFVWRDQKLSPGQVLVACRAWWRLTAHQREAFRKEFGWPQDGLITESTEEAK